MTNEQEIRRIVREEIRAAFEAMYRELPWGNDTYEAAETVSRRFGKCQQGPVRQLCEHDAPAEHKGLCTTCIRTVDVPGEGYCAEHGGQPADPDASIPFTVTPLAARFQDVPPAMHAPAPSAWTTGTHPACTTCGHVRSAHGKLACIGNRNLCPCPVRKDAK